MKEKLLNDIKKQLENIDDEIVCYGYALNLTIKSDDKKCEYARDFISIKKNYPDSPLFPPPITRII